MTPVAIARGLIAAALIGAALSACGGAHSTGANSPGAEAPTPTPTYPPTFVEVKAALESTGITLCDNSDPGNTHERLFGQSTTGGCSLADTAGQGIIRIFMEDDADTFASDKRYAKHASGKAWAYGSTILVQDDAPAMGTDDAMARLGFQPIN